MNNDIMSKCISAIEILYWEFYNQGIIPSWNALKKLVLKKRFTKKERLMMSEIIDLLRFYDNNMMRLTKKERQLHVKNYGFSDDVMCWFIPANDIQHQIHQIEKTGIEVNQSELGWYLWLYFTINFNHSLLRFYEIKCRGQKLINCDKDSAEIRNFIKRLDHHSGDGKGLSPKDQEMSHLIEKFQKYFYPDIEKADFLKSIIALISGNEINLIRKMKRDCFWYYHNEISEYRFCVITWDFFKLILPNKFLQADNDKEKATKLGKIINYTSKKVDPKKKTRRDIFVKTSQNGRKNKRFNQPTKGARRTNSEAS